MPSRSRIQLPRGMQLQAHKRRFIIVFQESELSP